MPLSWVVTFGSAALCLSFLMGHVHGRWVARRNLRGQFEKFD